MKKGIALEEDDRRKWLESIRHLIVNNKNEKNLIIACSALRRSYRRYLTGEIDDISDTKKKKGIIISTSRDIYLILLFNL